MIEKSTGSVVGLLHKVKADTYSIASSDVWDVPKAGYKVETYSAEKGQGVVYVEKYGNVVNVRDIASTKGKVIGKIKYEYEFPDPYDCLGKENGWYKIRCNGKVGYVREDLVNWYAVTIY